MKLSEIKINDEVLYYDQRTEEFYKSTVIKLSNKYNNVRIEYNNGRRLTLEGYEIEQSLFRNKEEFMELKMCSLLNHKNSIEE